MVVVNGGAVRNHWHIIRLRHRCDPAGGGVAAAPLHLRLNDVSSVVMDDVVKGFVMELQVASGEENWRYAVAQDTVALGGPSVLQRVLKPFHVVIADPFGDPRAEFDVPRKIAINHDFHVVA